MSFASMQQLKQRSWPTQEEAIKELKRNGFKPRGADYEIREYKPGSWQVMPLDEAEGVDAPPTESAAKPNGKAKKLHPADVAAQAVIDAAKYFTVHFRVSPSKKIDQTAPTKDAAIAIAMELNKLHGKNGRRATIYAVADDKKPGEPVPYDHDPKPAAKATPPVTVLPERAARGIKKSQQKKASDEAAKKAATPAPKKAAAAPKVETKPAEPQNDMTPLPEDAGPYHFVIGRAEPMPQFKIADRAWRLAKDIGSFVEIVNAKGATVRTMDWRIGGARVPRTATTRGPSQPRGEGKQAKAIALLKRPGGATAKELAAVTDWPIAQRHINRLAKVSGLKAMPMGDKAWQLVSSSTATRMRRPPRKVAAKR